MIPNDPVPNGPVPIYHGSKISAADRAAAKEARREENRRKYREESDARRAKAAGALAGSPPGPPPAWMDKAFPDMPPDLSPAKISALPMAARWKRYFQAWDVSCGVQTLACLFAGFTREAADAAIAADPALQKMKSDTDFKIADRMKMVLHMHIGAMRKHPSLGRERVSENLLGQTIKAMNRELYGDEGEGSFTVSLNIPRPVRVESAPPAPPAPPAPSVADLWKDS